MSKPQILHECLHTISHENKTTFGEAHVFKKMFMKEHEEEPCKVKTTPCMSILPRK
jgi:hypothetical protein